MFQKFILVYIPPSYWKVVVIGVLKNVHPSPQLHIVGVVKKFHPSPWLYIIRVVKKVRPYP